jgi:hypothetical protein
VLKCYSWQRSSCLTGNSDGHAPFAINGTGPFVGPPDSNRRWVFCGLGGADALLDVLDAPLPEGLLGGALLGGGLLGDGLLGATLLAATLPLALYA